MKILVSSSKSSSCLNLTEAGSRVLKGEWKLGLVAHTAIPVFRRLRWEDHELEAGLGYRGEFETSLGCVTSPLLQKLKAEDKKGEDSGEVVLKKGSRRDTVCFLQEAPPRGRGVSFKCRPFEHTWGMCSHPPSAQLFPPPSLVSPLATVVL